MRYMFGQVTVRTITVEADDQEKALVILKDLKVGLPAKVITENKLTWGETPDRDITFERDGVLADFLDLMHSIPRCSAADFITFPDQREVGDTGATFITGS